MRSHLGAQPQETRAQFYWSGERVWGHQLSWLPGLGCQVDEDTCRLSFTPLSDGVVWAWCTPNIYGYRSLEDVIYDLCDSKIAEDI